MAIEAKLQDRALQKIERDMGEILLSALNDSRTIEIMCNPDGQIWHERLGEPMKRIGHIPPSKAEALIKTVAGFHGKEITELKPLLECEFPLDRSRFAGQIPPIVRNPSFAIRKKAVAIYTLEQYHESKIISDEQIKIIKEAVRQHKNILVVGGTGSGKTTLVNAIINEMVNQNKNERIVIIEDTGEIQCAAHNIVQYHTTLDVNMAMLLKTTLRMRPDRILVGEVRGKEALDLLMAWNTGHPGGAATLHADNARAGLSRLSTLVSMHSDAPRFIEPLIGEAVHIIVNITRTPEGRKVSEIIEIEGYQNEQFRGSRRIRKK